MSNARDSVAVAPPMAMQLAKRWLLWNVEHRTNRKGESVAVKVPRYVDGLRRAGDLTKDGDRLVTYDHAQAALALHGFTGLGFALGEGWQGIDFDHIDKRPALAELVATLPGYVEYSPSGTGVHAIGFGRAFTALGSNTSGIEAYCTGRFFTFTGHRIGQGEPHDLSDYLTTNLRARHASGRSALASKPREPVPITQTDDRQIADIISALTVLDADDRETWIGVGQELCSLGERGREIWSQWSDTEKHPGGDELERWSGFSGANTGPAGVFRRAEAAGWKNPRRLDAAAIFAGSELVHVNGAAYVPDPPALEQTTDSSSIPEPPTVPVVARMAGQDYREADGKQRAATLENVIAAIGPSSGMRIVHDDFQSATLIVDGKSGEYRQLVDNDYTKIRAQLGRGGFKPISLEVIRAAVEDVALDNRYDFAIAWADSLQWDGIERIENVMHTHYGCESTEYTRAVGRYLFTGLAGRALVPGIQADMAVIMIGVQGARKTSAISVLAPNPQFFGEIDLHKKDDDLARRLRGKLVVEWAELRGLSGRDQEGIKAWVTRRHEEWRPVYKEFNTRFARRCIIIGSGNGDEILDDPTGERRWLPVHAGQADVAMIERDRDQLWAEGVVRFKADGIAWQDAEALAVAEHGKFKIYDDWTAAAIRWLDSYPVVMLGDAPEPFKNGEKPFRLVDLAVAGLQMRLTDVDHRVSLKIGKILRNLGFDRIPVRDGTFVTRLWTKATR